MPKMTYKSQGYHNATDEEVPGMIADGWTTITDEEFQKIIENKRAAKTEIKKALPYSHSKVRNGHSTIADQS